MNTGNNVIFWCGINGLKMGENVEQMYNKATFCKEF